MYLIQMEKLEYKSIRNEPTQRGMKRKMGVARDIRLYDTYPRAIFFQNGMNMINSN